MKVDINGPITLEDVKNIFETGGNSKTEKYWDDLKSIIDRNSTHTITINQFTDFMEKLILA